MKRRRFLASASAMLAAPLAARAEPAGDAIRPLVILTRPQAAAPQEYQAAEMMAQSFRDLGLDVSLRPLPGQAQSQVVWYERTRWDGAMWSMVGRPERSDPDELVYNLFVSANAANGYDFVNYINPDYDRLAAGQRSELDPAKRQALVREAQELVSRDQPYGFLVHPINLNAFNTRIFDAASVVDQAGIGIRNFWTWLAIAPTGSQRDIVLNATAPPSQALNPFYIPGAQGSWITEILWDRLMRIGPDGLPHPWAAESVTRPTSTTVDITLRDGMTWHDGSPVTVEDAVFSLQAPGFSDKAPMYKPFVANIANVEPNGPRALRITLKRPDAAFLTSTLSKLNLAPKKVWEPIFKGLEGKPQTAETVQEPKPLGSGPFRMVRFKLDEEVVLEANPDHWAKPKAARWIFRNIPNIETTMGALKSGEINFLADYTGDPKLLTDLASSNPEIKVVKEVDIGFIFLAYNERRPPFDNPAFRRALSAAIDRQAMAEDAWSGAALPANSMVSPALKFWHDPDIEKKVPGGDGNIEAAKQMLKEAGFVLVDGKLHYPPGVKETTQPYQ